jgi:hypothetical protein
MTFKQQPKLLNRVRQALRTQDYTCAIVLEA